MKFFKITPFFLFILILYNVIVFIIQGETQNVLNADLFNLQLISGSLVALSINDLLIILGVIALYIEILKSTRASSFSVIEHAFSMLVFVAFLIEFIVVRNAGNAAFLILTLMSLLDVIAGFTVSISTARRDFQVIRD
jgi:hypothetical protein